MGWEPASGIRRRGSSSSGFVIKSKHQRRNWGSVAIIALLLAVIGICVLLLNRLSSADQSKGLHVVEQDAERPELNTLAAGGEAAGDGGGGGAAAAAKQHAAEGGAGDGGKAAAEDAAAAAQAALAGEAVGGEGAKAGANGRPPSKFAQELQRQREAAAAARGAAAGTAAAAAGSGQVQSRVRQRVNYPVYFEAKPDPPVVPLSPEEVASRREAVKAAILHAWRGYTAHAWGFDELCPVSQKGKNDFGGLGATIVDSLDTLHMMGLHEEYRTAADWVLQQMPLDADFDASVFESIIRVVGGLLSAHDLTGDPALLKKAQQVADRLLPAYDTPTRIPLNIINLKSLAAKNPTWNQRASTLAEFGTHQLEFWRLSQGTGNATYAELAEATIRHLHKLAPDQGLMPLFVSPRSGNFTARRVSFGALGDSYYEYLLKMWLIKGKTDDMYRSMWEKSMDDMLDKLVFVSKDSNLSYIAEFDRYGLKHKFDHLVCFVPGMLGLGVHTGAVPPGPKAQRYMAAAAELTRTCWHMYHRMPTGLSPEYVTFNQQGMRVGAAYNLLRPEALEAMWHMWRFTKDWRYRTWAWEIFQAFQTHCKAEAGYSGLKDVRAEQPVQDDTMQSFFLAETLKYLWLIFSEDDAFDFNSWVLNTEAHPLKVSQPSAAQQATLQQAAHAAADGGASVARRRSR